ncbi:MAG: hypothetical protein JW940_05895 [Polyangiaceae bacterium]|nr:hypothetical protein [Polyangiaceae bacterium]
MQSVVFLGPTLPVAEARALLAAEYRPPAAFGDVYRAALGRPTAIAIIDGVFERQPAVWHKEILWAMTQGVHVLGASSIGALRAAELAPLGMLGVGKVFEAFHAGVLQDDDEVAIAHGPVETGYAGLSVAMVDIRATIEAARSSALIGDETAAALVRAGKRLHFRERSYAALLGNARQSGISAQDLDRFDQWLPTGRVEQKRADAVELLRELARWEVNPPPPHQPSYWFSQTDAWESARASMDRTKAGSPDSAGTDPFLLEEVAVAGRWAALLGAAFERALAVRIAEASGYHPDRESMLRCGESLRAELGLADKSSFETWLAEQDLDGATLPLFLRNEASYRYARAMFRSEAEAQVSQVLQIRGEWLSTSSRARRKRELLQAAGLENPSLGDAQLTEDALWTWYFDQVLHQPRPRDMAYYATSAGFGELGAMRDAVLRERLARTLGLE